MMVVIIIVIIVSIGVYHYFKKKERKFSKKFKGVKKFDDISSYLKILNKFDQQFYQYDTKRFKQYHHSHQYGGCYHYCYHCYFWSLSSF